MNTGKNGRRDEIISVKNEVIDLLTEYAINERLSRIVEEDEEKYTGLKSALIDNQKELLESFIVADSEMNARMKFLTYQQGLKDMFSLIMSLMDKEEEQA